MLYVFVPSSNLWASATVMTVPEGALYLIGTIFLSTLLHSRPLLRPQISESRLYSAILQQKSTRSRGRSRCIEKILLCYLGCCLHKSLEISETQRIAPPLEENCKGRVKNEISGRCTTASIRTTSMGEDVTQQHLSKIPSWALRTWHKSICHFLLLWIFSLVLLATMSRY